MYKHWPLENYLTNIYLTHNITHKNIFEVKALFLQQEYWINLELVYIT